MSRGSEHSQGGPAPSRRRELRRCGGLLRLCRATVTHRAGVGKSRTGRRCPTFPWGSEFSCLRGNFGNFGGDGRCAEDGAPGTPVAVGSFGSGASPYGALDMAGNVWEWVEGRYGYVADRGGTSPVTELRVIRGGGCCSILGLPRVSNRLALPRSYRDVDIGFRCARGAAPVPQPSAEQPKPRSDGGR